MDKQPPKNSTVSTGADTSDQSLETAGPTTPSQSSGSARPPVRSPLRNVFGFYNKFFFIFILLIAVVAAITYISLQRAKKTNPNTAASSLTSQQVANLKGSTSVLGNSQQTLDIQSDSIFEGSVLLRKDLDVAGSIKVGGNGLSIPAITVGGTGNFAQAQVNGTLSVGGNSTLQGQLNVQKGLSVVGAGSFGSLSAGQLTVSSLQLSGDLTISHHLAFNGGIPSKTSGTALGGGGTASLSGSDSSGTVTANTGSGPVAGCFISITFAQKYNSTPHVIVSPSNSSAGSLDYYTNRSSTGFSICTNSAPAAGSSYIFDYFVVD